MWPKRDFRQALRPAGAGLTLSAALVIVFGLWNLPLAAQSEEELTLCQEDPNGVLVEIENIRSSDGLLTVELYDDNPDGFIKKKGRIDRLRVEALEGKTEVCLLAPGPGTYAVVLYHDENGNQKFDKNFLGIPKEGFGVSNNPGFSFGAPKHEEAAFRLDEKPVALSISVNYL